MHKQTSLIAALLMTLTLQAEARTQLQDIHLNQAHIDLSHIDQSGFEIINGVPAAADHPMARSVVNIMKKMPMGFGQDEAWMSICTGSVLHKKYILTAAHCVDRSNPESFAVNFSVNTVDNSKQRTPEERVVNIEEVFEIRKVKALKIHPDYDGSGRADLAVLLLEKKAPRNAKPVTLLPDSWLNKEAKTTALEGQRVQVSLLGYGLVSERPRISSQVMRMTSLPARFEGNYVITDQTGGTGGCNGDSGGPAFLEYKGWTFQVGVTHGPHGSSTTCAEEGQWVNPGLDKEFINQAMKELK